MESRSSRRIIGSLARGADLVPALLAACAEAKVRAGVITAQGALERVEIASLDLGSGRFRAGRALDNVELVSLRGHLAIAAGELDLSAKVLVARDRESAAGHLVGGRVWAVEYVVEAWDDVELPRSAGLGYRAWGARAAEPEKPKGPPSWADVAAASPPEEPDEPDDSLGPGDVLLHPTFGRAEVMRIEGAYEFAHVRLRNGRLVRLSLDVLKVSAAGSEDGRRVFKARVDG